MSDEVDGTIDRRREAEAKLSRRVLLRFVESEGDRAVRAEEAVLSDDRTHAVSTAIWPCR